MGRAGSVNIIYRSVPPRPLSYTFSDVLQTSLEPARTPGRAGRRSRSRTAPVSTNAPEEYAERFKARPTTRPAVIEFNGTSVTMYAAGAGGGGRGIRRLTHHGFPAVRARNVAALNSPHAAAASAGAKLKTPAPAVSEVSGWRRRGGGWVWGGF